MKRLNHTSCPLCHGDKISLVLSTTDYSISGEDYDIWECESCSGRFTQNAPDQESISSYYKSEDYISHSDTKKGIVNALYHRVRGIMLARKFKLVNKYAKSGTLLDYGCGTGYFPAYVKSKGKSVKAIEIDPEARAFAQKKWGLEVYEPEALTNGEFNNHSFSVISLWHVMEHLYNPEEYMKRFHQLLHNDGTLVIAVPNYTSKDGEFYGKHWAAYDVPRHLWHFNPVSMVQFAERNGFTLLSKEKMPFDSFYVSLLSEKYKKGSTSMFAGFLNGYKSYIKSMKNPDLCSSVIYVFKKD